MNQLHNVDQGKIKQWCNVENKTIPHCLKCQHYAEIQQVDWVAGAYPHGHLLGFHQENAEAMIIQTKVTSSINKNSLHYRKKPRALIYWVAHKERWQLPVVVAEWTQWWTIHHSLKDTGKKKKLVPRELSTIKRDSWWCEWDKMMQSHFSGKGGHWNTIILCFNMGQVWMQTSHCM